MLSSASTHSADNHNRLCCGPVQSPGALSHKIVRSFFCCLVSLMNYFTNARAVRHLSAGSYGSSHDRCPTIPRDIVPEAGSLGVHIAPGAGSVKTSSQANRQSSFARRKTTLYFCRPPPSTRQSRLRFRPKVLLQLQETSEEARPTPAFDVLSASFFASRLGKEFPGAFKGKHGLGLDDLVVVESEDYSSRDPQGEESDDGLQKDTWKNRDIVAATAHYGEAKHDGRSNGVEICLNSGRSWSGSPMSKGGYEFVTADQQGLRIVARWVPRRGSRRQSTGYGNSPLTSPTEEKAFNFSLIDPSSRRHAVIARFDSTALEISDRYNTPLAESADQPPTPASEKSLSMNDSIKVDAALRILIIVTSVWVSFCEGLFDYDHATEEVKKPQALPPNPQRRSLSINRKGNHRHSIHTSYSSGLGTIPPRPSGLQMSPLSSTAPTLPVNPPVMSHQFTTPPRRTQSTGTRTLDRSNSRHACGREAETLSPVPDFVDISSFDTRPTKSSKLPTALNVHAGPSAQPPKPAKERNKRSSGIKRLCYSLRNSVRLE